MDCMIYSDGAGATLLEATSADAGILSHIARSDTFDHAFLLRMRASYDPRQDRSELYFKMNGHDTYRYAVKTVPLVVKQNLEKSGLGLGDIKRILIHQANEKMDAAIIKRLFDLFKVKEIPADIMPMIISWTGNSSVATLPTLLVLIMKGQMDDHCLEPGDLVVFASVGAGMNINSMIYKMP
jgi:3-oxoacyl-[acyl-carrier-protein] synthase-3